MPAAMGGLLDSEGSGIPFIPDREEGTSGTGIMAVTTDPVPANKAVHMKLSGAPDIEKGCDHSEKKRGGMKVTFRVSPCRAVA